MASVQALFRILGNDLDHQGFDVVRPPPPDASRRAVAAYALHRSFLKKYQEGESVPDEAQSRAILTFLETIHLADKWSYQPESSIDEQLMGDIRLLMYRFWEVKTQGQGNPPLPLFGVQDLGPFLRPGPGASVLAEGNDFYTKLFASPLSSTSPVITAWYRRLIQPDYTWSEAEDIRSRLYGSGDTVVQGSHLSVVPKNNETGRCICTEPSVNMLFQLACGTLLEKRLKETYGIGLDTQPFKNQALARLGSRNGNYATIDLKSASDSLSMRMLKHVLPDSMFKTLSLFRSAYTRIPGIGWFELPIISTMGNGYTFPLQTILFTCIVHACYRLHDLKLDTRSGSANFGVFGDDIIVDVRVFRSVLRALKLLGFTVNQDKTFFEGPFRESCGADYYNGYNVRGFYLKRLRTQQDFYVAINRLNSWTMQTGIPIPSVMKYLLARCKWLPVPLWENDDAGIKIPYSMVAKRLRKDRFVQSPLYRYYSAIPLRFNVEGDDRQENPEGALVAFLNGTIRNGRISRRSSRLKYALKWDCAPNWDCKAPNWDDPQVTPADSSAGSLGQRWNTAVVLNLFG